PDRAPAETGPLARRLPRPPEPPPALALLPCLGEVPPAPPGHARRERRALDRALLPLRTGHARAPRAARRRRPGAPLLHGAPRAAAAFGHRARCDPLRLLRRAAGRRRAVRRPVARARSRQPDLAPPLRREQPARRRRRRRLARVAHPVEVPAPARPDGPRALLRFPAHGAGEPRGA